MTIWDHLCCYGYGIQARWSALGHLVRGHDLHWRGDCIDLWTGHMGCITCEACTDSSIENGHHLGVCFWMRDSRLIWWCGRTLCGWLGHSELRHPKQWNGLEPIDDEANMIDVEGEWYCYRCLGDVPRDA